MATRSSYDQWFSSATRKELREADGEPGDVKRGRQEIIDVVLFDLEFLPVGEAGESIRSEFLKKFLSLLPRETRLIVQALRARYTWEELAIGRGQSIEEVQHRFRRDVDATLMKLQVDLIDERSSQTFTR